MVQEINGVPVQCLEQEFYHLMHIFSHFCLPPPPAPTHTFSIPFSKTTLSFELVLALDACYTRVGNFITLVLYQLNTYRILEGPAIDASTIVSFNRILKKLLIGFSIYGITHGSSETFW